MAPVANPDLSEAGSSSSCVQQATSQFSWPDSVQLRLEELQESLEEEEITRKGYWKKKYQLVEKFLNKDQLKKVSGLHTDYKEGKVSDNDYYEQLQSLLVPREQLLDEGVEDEAEAMICEEKDSKEAKEDILKSDDLSAASSSSKPDKEAKIDPVKTEDINAASSSSLRESRPKRSSNQPSIKDMFNRPAKRKSKADLSSTVKRLKEEGDGEGVSQNDTIKKAPVPVATRCKICRQFVDSPDLLRYEDHPQNARPEVEGIFDPSISISMGEDAVDEPEYKVTLLTCYDKEGHVVRLDTDLIEKNKEIYFSGYLKHLTCEDPSSEDGIPVYDCGPIVSWWNTGFDGGEKCILGLSTSFAMYHVMEPSDLYRPFLRMVKEKNYLVKYVIEFLEKAVVPENHLDCEYEDLMNHLSLVVPPPDLPPFDDEILLKHADFLVHQVYSYEDAGDEDDMKLVQLPAMKSLIKLAGIKLSERKKQRSFQKKKPMPQHTDATVTPLVRDVFEAVFGDQMVGGDEDRKTGKARSQRCGVCEQCMRSDCGQCRNCKDMTKFGGSGRSKQACKERKCLNKAVKVDDGDESEEEEGVDISSLLNKSTEKTTPKKTKTKGNHKEVEWLGDPITTKRKTYYRSVILDGELTVSVGDSVLIQPSDPSIPLYVARVSNLFLGPQGATAHVVWYGRGVDTVLGEAADNTELFQLTDCEDQPLLSIWKKCSVDFRPQPDQEAWRLEGGKDNSVGGVEDDGVHFSCQFHYNPSDSRFEYPIAWPECDGEEEEKLKYCGCCVVKQQELERWEPSTGEKNETDDYVSIMWDRAPLKIGDSVYLEPNTVPLKIKKKRVEAVTKIKENVDEDLYPEYYRKRTYVKGNNNETPDPFQVVSIKKIIKDGAQFKLEVSLFYRPEDTHKGISAAETAYNNEVYFTEEVGTVLLTDVRGRCHVKFIDMSVSNQEIETWSEEGPDRWFFREWYRSEIKEFEEPPLSAQRIGQKGKGGGKGKGGKGGKGKSSAPKPEEEDISKTGTEFCPSYPPVESKLRGLDIFAGCGGLSQGLHESGVATTNFAIEIFDPAARAYKLNNPNCTVFSDDCNILLSHAMTGVTANSKGQRIPRQGEVDILCGGPPCQGFSGMNRFNQREYSQFKNSLVSTYLSYCDYYRPRFFILENVKNFANYKKGMVLKLCLRTLVKMGYQCTFAVLQAGQFGVAQTRRRAIILAAAPGEKLPLYPEPRHVFSPSACQLSVQIDDVRYESNVRWKTSAPYRTVTVRDTMSDLPRIKNGHDKLEISYGGEPRSHFQKMIRKGSEVLCDHITKNMAPLIEARFELIPTTPGSDWRDLPNKVVQLKDGSWAKKLMYYFHDVKQGLSSTGAKRGVCACADGKSKCDPSDKQDRTLIPWCLPHTSARHNQWAGLYGRVEWDGFFSTTITNPEPMGKQGRVLHPDQNRLVSVRECARSQGFPDSYKFYGSALDKHRQIGNAVPPPMGKALGHEIRKAMAKREA